MRSHYVLQVASHVPVGGVVPCHPPHRGVLGSEGAKALDRRVGLRPIDDFLQARFAAGIQLSYERRRSRASEALARWSR